jgi:Ca2+-binding EF-hand superfamily protein
MNLKGSQMKLDPAELKELRESFRYNDANRDGRIEFPEFVEMLGQLEAEASDEEARIGFDEIDTDDDGAISFDEFVAWWQDR